MSSLVQFRLAASGPTLQVRSYVRAPAAHSAPVRAVIARKNARPSGDRLLVVQRKPKSRPGDPELRLLEPRRTTLQEENKQLKRACFLSAFAALGDPASRADYDQKIARPQASGRRPVRDAAQWDLP